MNDSRRDTSDPASDPKSEDLDVVLGRFKDWAETRRSKPSANPGMGTGTGRSLGEAREVSYEEALRASSYRRSVDLAAMDPLLPELDCEKAVRVTPEGSEPRLAEPPWEEDLTPRVLRVGQTNWPALRFVKTAEAITTDPPSLETGADSLDGPHFVTQIAAEDQQPTETLSLGAKIGVVEAPGVTAAVPHNAEAVQVAVQPKAVTKAKPPATPRKQLRQPAFRDVLKGTAALVAAAQPGAALERGKSTSLTLRVSDGEQARIQACAAQANLSVSAYLRQCALGVDDLRNQVELALSTLHQQQARSAPQPGLSAIPGILGRCVVQCLRRLRPNPRGYTVVSLR